jgi:hypothetical protein
MATPWRILPTKYASRLPRPGGQTATLRRIEGAQAAGTGELGEIIAEGVPVSTGGEAQMTQVGDYRFFVGWRSDPFFFDVQGTLNNFQFTGEDFFADKDICSIVLDLSSGKLQQFIQFCGSPQHGTSRRSLFAR